MIVRHGCCSGVGVPAVVTNLDQEHAMLRGFIDSTGVEWRVWEVLPSKAERGVDALTMSSLKATPFADGWLCFESPEQKRRLAPIPQGWESREPSLLEQLCAQATVVPLRRRAQGSTSAVA